MGALVAQRYREWARAMLDRGGGEGAKPGAAEGSEAAAGEVGAGCARGGVAGSSAFVTQLKNVTWVNHVTQVKKLPVESVGYRFQSQY